MNAPRKGYPASAAADAALDAPAVLEHRGSAIAKRALDVVVAGIGLILSAPLWGVVTAAVKLDDRGPIFYRQTRFGLGGKHFSLLKFRTMRVSDGPSKLHQARENDERVTRVGKVLRAMGLDELPQLWSIFIGDMSLVGPRALAVGEAIRAADGRLVRFEDIPGFAARLAVKPGLTGTATIYLAKDADPLDKLAADLSYIRDRSFTLDVKLIVLSLWISLRGKWETRGAKL